MLKNHQQLKLTLRYLPADGVQLVQSALSFAAHAHTGQLRKSGEEYIVHPVAVAQILASLQVDAKCVAAGLLHDVAEDTKYTSKDIEKRFGTEIASLVEGVTKIQSIPSKSKYETQAESCRKMLLAVCKDIRVLIIKLADRLHNMQTIEVMSRSHQRRVAKETLEIYAPLGRRLGMNSLAAQLEQLGFCVLYPLRSRTLVYQLEKAQLQSQVLIDEVTAEIEAMLNSREIPFGYVKGRRKNTYSIYKKMQQKRVGLAHIPDMYAIRVCVEKKSDCYLCLGLIHGKYRPMHSAFKDYIALPKSNGYQSLHTVIFGPSKEKIEIQIRTSMMDYLANTGIAAHCLYKSKEKQVSAKHVQAQQWLSKIMTMHQQVGTSLEFMEHVKIDLCPDDVYVLTPDGAIVELPLGSTVLDFAYAVHTDMGNSCVAARVDQQFKPLSTVLENGQTIEVITRQGAKPSSAWLAWLRTAKARSALQHFLRLEEKDGLVVFGKNLLSKYMPKEEKQEENIARKAAEIKSALDLKSINSVYEGLALGVFTGKMMRKVWDICGSKGPSSSQHVQKKNLVISNKEHASVHYAGCCSPLPGDPARAVLVRGQGLCVHHKGCKELIKRKEENKEIWVIKWSQDLTASFNVNIELKLVNQRGVLAAISMAIAEEKGDVQDFQVYQIDHAEAVCQLKMQVGGRVHLAKIMRKIQRVHTVLDIKRMYSENE